MRQQGYKFQRHKSSARERDELAAAIREITPAVNTLAEEERRRHIIRTCEMMDGREQREEPNRGNPTWHQ